MKRIYACALAIALGTLAFAENENVVVWEQIYRRAESYEQRTAVMHKIMEFQDRDFAPLLTEALDGILASTANPMGASEKFSMNELAILVVRELGNLKSTDAAESIYQMYLQGPTPELKAEAVVSLGNMRATDYAERLAFDLKSVNLKPNPASYHDQEIVALGLVKALDSMRSIVGYEPVFLASIGWYSATSNVRQTARAALQTMVDDPSETLLQIITTNPDLEVKITAFDTLLLSKAAADRKALVASKTLEMANARNDTDVGMKAKTSKLKVMALDALITAQDHTAANVPLYDAVILADKRNDATLEETLKAYMALGVNGTDEASKYLAAKLSEYNERERSKANTVRDKSLIKQIVISMKETKNKAVLNSLSEGLYIDYDASILRLMRETQVALK